MQTLELDLNKRYTYADYLTWFDNVRRELINGFIKLMSPAPARYHQKIVRKLSTRIDNYLYKKKCEVYFAPFDVRLPNEESATDNQQIYTVVQPDICIICDPAKLDDKGCLGAPDCIIEIVSPTNSKHDVQTKFNLYENHGVHEYWLVFPYEHVVEVFLLDANKKYQSQGKFAGDDSVRINVLDELYINLEEIF